MTEPLAPGQSGQGAPDGGAGSASAPPAWHSGADDVTTGYIQNKGWDSPLKVVESYRNLEKLFGQDKAGNTVVMPKPDAAPEEFGKFYDRLGRPSAPDGYKFQVPEGANPEFAKLAQGKFHELGLTQKQGEALASWWNDQATGAMTAQQEQAAQAFQADDQALRAAWGAAFTQELNKAQAAARALGVTEEQIDSLQKAMGHKNTMEFFNKIGNKMGEPDFASGSSPERFGNAMTPEQARAAIQAKLQDKDFVAKYVNGNAEAKAEMARLHNFAYPE